MAVVQVTSRDFRNNQRAMFELADKGETVMIRRRSKPSYMLTPVKDLDLIPSPRLRRIIAEGRKEMLEGKTVHCKNAEEAMKFLESL